MYWLQSVSYLQLGVESCDDDSADVDGASGMEGSDVILQSIEKLNLDDEYHSFFMSNVYADIEDIGHASPLEGLKKYSSVLQKHYTFGSSSVTEVNIKRIIKDVVPKMFSLSLFQIESDKENVTGDDQNIVQYLSGAVLKWGIRALPEEGKNWCKRQVSKEKLNSVYFQQRDRGLLAPTKDFFCLMMLCENEFRQHRMKRRIHVQSVVSHVDWPSIYGDHTKKETIEKLLSRYTRMRAHILCKHAEYLNKKKKRNNKSKPSSSLMGL